MDSSGVMKDLQNLAKSKSVKAVVIRIDSPGGGVAASQEIFEEVKKLKATKPVVVSMGSMAASGGYYIACAADKIYASAGTVTGSIGVIMESFGLQNLLQLVQLESRVLKSGTFKDVGSPMREMTPDEKAYLQQILDNMYQQFTKAVAEQRGFSEEQIQMIAEGKVYTGQQAVEVGLVDSLGTLYDAIAGAKKLAGLPDDAHVLWPRDEDMPFDWIASSLGIKKWIQGFLKQSTLTQEPKWLYQL